MKRARVLWWTPLAAHCSHAIYVAPQRAHATMSIQAGLHEALVVGSKLGCRRLVVSYREHSVRRTLSRSSRKTRVLQSRMISSTSSQGEASPGVNPTTDAEGKQEPARRRSSSRYIPSGYRGVVGGPKGKWKARIVSKGGVRHLGTFG